MIEQGTPTELCSAFAGAHWTCCSQPPGAIADATQLREAACDWIPAQVPGTVASALRAAGKWDEQNPADIDAQDWWYRTTFPADSLTGEQPCMLCFDGLSMLAEVWLNGECLLTANNMFRSYRVDVAQRLRSDNELVIAFRSVASELKKRRPRPRWKTNLVNNQQLRWQRTSLLGRIPGWTPPVPAVGPWLPVRLEQSKVLLSEISRTSTLDGEDGIVVFQAHAESSTEILSARLQVGEHAVRLEVQNGSLSGQIRVPQPPLWWPHTHGTATLLDCILIIETAAGQHVFPLERVGFRRLEVREEPGFGVRVNDQLIFCRGACWTTSDIFTLAGSEQSLRHDLQLARDAGMNMIRIGGTMIYESDAFYRLCDELGILVWQDFMFANMDYPVEDAAFLENITAETRQQLDRLAQHPCVAIYCGNSEIEQQAAMLGMPRELWRNRWFGEDLPALCSERHPGTAYVPSSPSGGVLPFHTKTGVTHFYGIGAYLRSMRELRQADVKFTSECLGFANIPEPEVIDEIMGTLMPATHHPRWKARVPRDTGAGWDFEDVRDHYLRELFNVDPATLRSFDMPRYLELSRVTSGEMMARTFAEWRSGHSNNAGALVWFYKDLWPASGWGIVDSHGLPKAAYYQLKRAWKPRQLSITDEGLDGLHLHSANESSEPMDGFLEVQLLREPALVVAQHEIPLRVDGHSTETRSIDEIIGSFRDVNYAYRFGPQVHHVVVATWLNSTRGVISESFFLTRSRDPEALPLMPGDLQTTAASLGDGRYQLTLQSQRFLHAVRISAKGFLPDDNYFHLPPGRQKAVTFTLLGAETRALRATIEALNVMGEHTVNASGC